MVAQSSTSISNRALQKVGAAQIMALTDNSREARVATNCYDFCRRAELRAHRWNFSFKRVQLAPDTTVPAFGYAYAFTLPTDCLYVPLPDDYDLDWQIEDGKILTNDTVSPWSAGVSGETPVLALRYIADVTDPPAFDALFCEALAARMAIEMVESLTQSNQKAQKLESEYKLALAVAASANAFEKLPVDPPKDPWLVAHET